MPQYTALFISKLEIARDTWLFVFSKPSGFTYKAGQCIDLIFQDTKFDDPRGDYRSFSIVSAPDEPTIAIAFRLRESPSPFKLALAQIIAGAKVLLIGPYGTFGLHKDLSRGIVIVAGGIGITPFISMLRDAFAKGETRPITLFYSNKTFETAPFFSELQQFATQHSNFTFVPTMTQFADGVAWKGEQGRINEEMVLKYIGAVGNQIFYTAGPLLLVQDFCKMLVRAGVPEDNIRTEEFPGY